MKRHGIKKWIYRPLVNYKEPITSMKELALSLDVEPCTLSVWKRRKGCIGLRTKPIEDWFFVIDDMTTDEELDGMRKRVLSHMEHEHWSPIFDGDYMVSNYGSVKSVKGLKGCSKTRGKKEHLLTPSLRGSGSNKLLSVYLRLKENNGKGKWYAVHRLVAEAFIEKEDRSHLKSAPEQKYVLRFDGKYYNCQATNLLWADHKVVERLSRDNGRQIPVVKLDAKTGNELDFYESITHAGKENFISYQSISLCLSDEAKTAAGFKWKVDTSEELSVVY